LPVFHHQHIESSAGRTRIHHLEADAGAQKLRAECGRRKILASAGAEQQQLGAQRHDASGVYMDEIFQGLYVGLRNDGGWGNDDGTPVGGIVHAQFAVAVSANDINGRSRVLHEAHALKILKTAGAVVSSLYFRFMARGGRAVSPLLERLLARADDYSQVSDWRADAVAANAVAGNAVAADAVAADEPLAAAPIALFAAHGLVSGAWACLATPVHYTAEMSNVRLAHDGILRLDPAAAAALALDFNRIWRDSGIAMRVGRFADLFCIFDAPLRVATQDPEAVLDRHIEDYLPQGADAPRLRRLMSEIEMWLFEHAATGVPQARHSSIVNGLWLWGGGAVRSSPISPDLKSAGEDALFSYFNGDVSRGGVVVAPRPDSAEWPAAEAQWLEPAVTALRSGRVQRLLLSGDDRCFTIRAVNLRRFWRRDRPWPEHFQ
jgi:hypothetical protein